MTSQIFLTTAVLSSSIWFGAMVFLSVVLAPIVFNVLTEHGASRLLRALFPRYYQLGIACGIVLHLALLCLFVTTGVLSTSLLWSICGSLIIILLGFYSLALIPRINRARDAGASMSKIFDQLHRRSVIMNVINIVITFGILINLVITIHLGQP